MNRFDTAQGHRKSIKRGVDILNSLYDVEFGLMDASGDYPLSAADRKILDRITHQIENVTRKLQIMGWHPDHG